MGRVILHCDMNNFFASVECLLDPSLKNKSIAVCGSVKERRGIVLAKNDAAKKLGVTTAEAIWQAKRKCPDLVIVSPHNKYYSLFSERAKEIYLRYTDLVEPMGIDECWLDVTSSVRLFGSGRKIADEIRKSVRDELGLTVSVGVSFNKVFAKLGSDMKKPDAVTVIDESNFKDKIYGLPVGDLLGVGKRASATLNKIGISTIGELALASQEKIIRYLGKSGVGLWRFANALDDSPVRHVDFKSVAKSVSRGTTLPCDLKTNDDVKRLIVSLVVSISRQLRQSKLVARGVQISIRDEKLKVHEFQTMLSRNSSNVSLISSESFELFKKRYDWSSDIHSLTVRVINLIPESHPVQISMFCDEGAYIRNCKKDSIMDGVERKFGKSALFPMVLLDYAK